MTDQKIHKLVSLLAQKTKENELAWEESEVPNAFSVSFTHGSARIEVRDSRAHRGDQEYVLRLLNANGDEFERLSDETLSMDGAYALLQGVYDGARRKAMGVDVAIDSMIDDLESGFFF